MAERAERPSLFVSEWSDGLTPREVQVATMASFYSSRETATMLDISIRTVETHIRNACRKTGAKSKRELGRRVHDIANLHLLD